MRTAAAVLGAVAVLATGCGGGDDEPSELEAAFCSDLEDGMSLAQLVPQVRDNYSDRDDPEASAVVFIDDAVRDHCPDYVDEWEATVLYEQWADSL